MITNYPAFLGVAFLIIVAPGPDTALLIRNAVVGGRRSGIATALGVVSGQAVWACATAVGLAAVLEASRPAFLAVRILGGCYLVYLGVHAVWSAREHRETQAQHAEPRNVSAVSAYRQGALSNLGNPKMVAFFTALMPQFVSHGSSQMAGFLLLGLSFSTLTLCWLAFYVAIISRVRTFLARSNVKRSINVISGLAMIVLGARLAAEAA